MGSRDMAVFKILSVLLVAGSFPAWTSPQFPNISPSTTPVPILRYVDNQNIGGSYTYGYEAADGTYKLETRYQDGRVKGKYGYVDPDGNLREASYGAEAGRGFEPQIAGLELPPPVVAEVEAVNEIVQQPPRPKTAREGEIKVINGRRAVVKKVRRVKATPAPRRFIDESAQRQAGLTARQEGLRQLEHQRQKLLELQRRQSSQVRQQPRSFSSFPSRQQESFRSVVRPAATPAASNVQDPFVSNIDLASGSYSYNY